MAEADRRSVWTGGEAYEPYVGRWSRLVAREFIQWLNPGPGGYWLDVGCGTGALSQTILTHAAPTLVHGIDPSAGYLSVARQQVTDSRAHFEEGDARRLPLNSARFDAVASGLVLNFIPGVEAGLAEMVRVAKPGGIVAAYVWDYAGKMELMRYFWDVAIALKPENRDLDEGRRFPICQPEPLRALFTTAGLKTVEVRSIDVPTHFQNFDDYWTPFLGGQFPAPDYAVSLSEHDRDTLRDGLRTILPTKKDGTIELIARAWAVRGMPA